MRRSLATLLVLLLTVRAQAAIPLREDTASQEVPLGYFLDSTDGNTEETGLTVANTDIKIWKSGATTLADKNSGGGTHISNGIYYAVLDATDTDTIGPCKIFVHVSGALPVEYQCVVYDEAVYDSLFGTTALSTLTQTQVTGGAYDLDTDANGRMRVVDGTGAGEIDTASGVVARVSLADTCTSINQIESTDATNQIRDSILSDGARFAGADIPAIKGFIDTEIGTLLGIVPVNGTIGATGNDTTHLHLSGLAYADDAINSMLLTIKDVSTNLFYSRWIEDFANTGDLATVATLPFTPEASVDLYWLIPVRADVTGGSGLDAAGVRAAIGLASANLDGQLVAIDDAVDSEVGAIKAKTDNLPADPADASDVAALIATLQADSDLYDTDAELCNAVFGCDATSEQVQGTFGQVLGDSAADTDTIWAKANNLPSDPADASDIATLIAAVQADTDNLQTRIPAALAGGLMSSDMTAISTDTTAANNLELAYDGTGYAHTGNTYPWTPAWDAEVQSENDDAIKANELDHLFLTTYDPASKPGAADALLNELVESDAGVARYTANALEQAPTGAGGDGSAFTDIPWNPDWDPEVESEVVDGLAVYDPPTFAELDARTDALDAAVLILDDFIDLEVAAIKAKTDGLPSDPADESNLTALLNAIDDFVDTEVAAIKAKTDGLPSDPADQSDLVALLNAIDDFVDTEVAAIKAKTDGLPGDPADESNLTALLNAIDDFVDTELAAVKAVADKLDTGLELDGAVYRATTNFLEQAPTGGASSDPTVLQTTTIATLASQVSFTLTAGSADNNAYRDCLAIVTDSVTSTQKAFGVVSAYTGASKTVTLAADPAIFTMAVGDSIAILAPSGDWDIAIANHLTTGTTGKKLSDAGASGDPWATPVPGAYPAGQAGYVLGNIVATLSASGVSVNSPLDVLSQVLEITIGDEYTVANGLAPTWDLTGAPSLTGTTVEFRAVRPDGGFYTEMATVVDADTLRIELVAAETGDVTKLGVPTTWSYHLRILTPFVLTVVQGPVQVFTTPAP